VKKRILSGIFLFGILCSVISISLIVPSKASAAGACVTDKTGFTEFDGLSDVDLMARLIYAEARGEITEGKRGIPHIVVNRALKNRSEFGGNTVRGVILNTKGGFDGMNTASARCPLTSSQGWIDSLAVANNPGSNNIGTNLWFNTTTLFNTLTRTATSGYLEYRFPNTTPWLRVMERKAIGAHTFFRVYGY